MGLKSGENTAAGRRARIPHPRSSPLPSLPCGPRGCPSPRPGPPGAWGTERPPDTFGKPSHWSNPPPPETLPYPTPCQWKRVTLCSCPSCEELFGAPVLHNAPTRRGVPARCSSSIHPRTQGLWGCLHGSSSSRQLSRTRRVLSHPESLFSAEAHAPESPRNGRLAHLHPGHLLEVLAPIQELGPGTFFYVGFQ